MRVVVALDFKNNQIKNVVAHQVTTAQRTTLGGTLTAAESGLFVQDVTDNNMYLWNGSIWVNLSQVITAPMVLKGEIANASTNPAFPASPAIGDVWVITTTAGTVGGLTVGIGNEIVYSTSGWFVVQSTFTDATTTVKGYVLLATQAQVDAGVNTTAVVTPATLATLINIDSPRPKIYRQTVVTLTANIPTTINHALNLSDSKDYIIKVSDALGTIILDDVAVDGNNLTIVSSVTLTNLRVVVEGL